MKTPRSNDISIWRGWAQCCVKDGITRMPSWVKSVVHADSKDPDIVWASLLAELAKPLCNEQRVSLYCMSLAWGDL